MTIKAAMEALTSDAKRWDEVSTALSTASGTASGLTLGSTAFPQLLGLDGLDLDGLYNRLQSKVQGLLSEGSTETGAIADALVQVRKDFESTDQSVRDALKGVWDIA